MEGKLVSALPLFQFVSKFLTDGFKSARILHFICRSSAYKDSTKKLFLLEEGGCMTLHFRIILVFLFIC